MESLSAIKERQSITLLFPKLSALYRVNLQFEINGHSHFRKLCTKDVGDSRKELSKTEAIHVLKELGLTSTRLLKEGAMSKTKLKHASYSIKKMMDRSTCHSRQKATTRNAESMR